MKNKPAKRKSIPKKRIAVSVFVQFMHREKGPESGRQMFKQKGLRLY